MNADTTSGNRLEKRAFLSRFAALIFHLLRMFWLTVLALLLLVLYGLHAGWSTPRQWSDGLFIAAICQVLISGITLMGSEEETNDASLLRYVFRGNVNEARQLLVTEGQRKETFGHRAFLGGVLTLLIALVAARV